MAFSSLNKRISSILSLTQLHVIISKLHCQSQVKFLSSHLTDHVDQVISISIEDQLYDFLSVIYFIFNQFTFKNLQSCIFYSVGPSSTFHTIIKKLEILNKLVLFRIYQSKDTPLSDVIKQELSETILTHKSPTFRSVTLTFSYNYPRFINHLIINTTITSLRMRFFGSIVTCSIYSLLPILRYFRALRILRLSINSNNYQTTMPILPHTYQMIPPISPTIKIFELVIQTWCDFHSLNFILHCMPNLYQFIITIVYPSSLSTPWKPIFDGYQWEQILTKNTPYLNIFDISLHKFGSNLILDIDTILQSFDYFQKKYNNWYLAIHRLLFHSKNAMQEICLRGCTHSKNSRYFHFSQTRMVLDTFNIYSKKMINTQDYSFYSHYRSFHINIPINKTIFNSLSYDLLFKNIHYLIIEFDSSMLTFWQTIQNLFNIRSINSKFSQNQYALKLKNLIDLNTIHKLEIQSKTPRSHVYFLQDILLVTSNLIELKIDSSLIFSSILYQNLFLIPIFNQLQSLYLLSKEKYFPLKYAFKLIEYFSSLIHLELEIYSIHICLLILNILLNGLSNLIHLKIHFHQIQFLDDIANLIKKSPHISSKKYSIEISKQSLDIYLNGCLICAKKTKQNWIFE